MKIRSDALKYLTTRSRTAGEMEAFLSGKGYERSEIAEEIAFLTEFHYLDDTGYAERYVEDSISKGKGLPRIEADLLQKKIAREVIEDACYACGIEDRGEYEKTRALAQAEKMAADNAPSDKLLGKIARKLAAQGFSSDAIYYAMGRIMRQGPKEEE